MVGGVPPPGAAFTNVCSPAGAPGRADTALGGREAGTPVARIGRIEPGDGVRAFDALGSQWEAGRAGYQHFA